MMGYILSLIKNFQMIMSTRYENPLLEKVSTKISSNGRSEKTTEVSKKLRIKAWVKPTETEAHITQVIRLPKKGEFKSNHFLTPEKIDPWTMMFVIDQALNNSINNIIRFLLIQLILRFSPRLVL